MNLIGTNALPPLKFMKIISTKRNIPFSAAQPFETLITNIPVFITSGNNDYYYTTSGNNDYYYTTSGNNDHYYTTSGNNIIIPFITP